jgi:hypothetical protein
MPQIAKMSRRPSESTFAVPIDRFHAWMVSQKVWSGAGQETYQLWAGQGRQEVIARRGHLCGTGGRGVVLRGGGRAHRIRVPTDSVAPQANGRMNGDVRAVLPEAPARVPKVHVVRVFGRRYGRGMISRGRSSRREPYPC